MKILVSTFALALGLAFTGPAFAGTSPGEERRGLREGWWHVGCSNLQVRAEATVTLRI